MIARLLALFQKPSPRPPEPRWGLEDAEALAQAIRLKRPRRALYQRHMDATHAQLSAEVWGRK